MSLPTTLLTQAISEEQAIVSNVDIDRHCQACGGHLYSEAHARFGCVGWQRLQIEETQRQIQVMSARLDFVTRLTWIQWNESILPPDLKRSTTNPPTSSRDLFNQSR